jgi:hypothetical protein
MSLAVRPIGRSLPFSKSGAGAAGVVFLSSGNLPAGWYLLQISASSDDATTAGRANLELLIGSTPFGFQLPTGAVTVPFEFMIQMEGSRAVNLRAIATSAGGKFILASMVLTPVEAPPVAAWSYDSQGVRAP